MAKRKNTVVPKVVKNVGELIEALKHYPTDMAIDVDVCHEVAVFLMRTKKGEIRRDMRGYVKLLGVED